LNKAQTVKIGKIPNTKNKMIPGMRKFEKGEFFRMDKGNPPNKLPDGEMINVPPPPIALTPKNRRSEMYIE
jgi:hypothetical protein